MLGERMKRNSMVDDNDKIGLKNKLTIVIYVNVGFLKVDNPNSS
jgi:hypothetical protein